MLKIITVSTLAAMAFAFTVTTQPAQAENGQIAAGVIGGLAVGAVVGSQMNRDDRYRDGGYRDDGYRRRAYYQDCRIERRDVEDRYGRIHVRTVRVCN